MIFPQCLKNLTEKKTFFITGIWLKGKITNYVTCRGLSEICIRAWRMKGTLL